MNRRLCIKSTVCFILAALFVLMPYIFMSCEKGDKAASSYYAGNGTYALIAPAPSTDSDYILIHGFLDTADSKGIPARLYTFDENTSSKDRAKDAKNDGCSGAVLLGCDSNTAEYLKDADMPVVTLLSECDDIHAVLIDSSEFYGDIALYLAEQMSAQGHGSGTIVIYGAEDAKAVSEAFTDALSSTDFSVKTYAAGMSMKDVYGIYAVSDTAGALEIAGDDVTVIGTGITEDSEEQFTNGLHALCVEPAYEAAAQSFLNLDRLIAGNGDDVPLVQTLNRPIVTSNGISRYLSERYRALLLFDVVTPSPAPTAVVPTDEPEATSTEEP